MAIQTLNLSPGLGAQFGAGLGTAAGSALGGLLEGLAETKLLQLQEQQQQRQQQKQADYLAALFGGLSPQQAQGLAGLNQQAQQTVLKDLLAQPAQQAYAQALGLGGEQSMQQNPLSAFESLKLLQGEVPQQLLQQPQMKQQQLPRLNERQATEIAKIRREEAKEQRKMSHEQQKESNKETKAYYDEIAKGAKSAKDSNIRLDRMERLVNEGKLQGNVLIKGLESLEKIPYLGPIAGAIQAAALNPQSQEFKKLSADFVKDAKNFFGSRITQKEVELFLETVPTLSQSSSGKRRIINNMRIFNDAALLRKQATDEIIDENKGNRPRNLDSLVEKRIGKQLDELAKKFAAGAQETRAQQEEEEYERAPGRRKIFKNLGVQLPRLF